MPRIQYGMRWSPQCCSLDPRPGNMGTGRDDGTHGRSRRRCGPGAPLADAKVTATSPSQSATTQTDATGHFLFISLAPDTYTVSAEKDGFHPNSTAGLTVFADATQTVSLQLQSALKEITRVASTTGGNLVKSGTTADVYSINAKQQDRANALGGGGTLDSAYSAIATVPGAYVPTNQAGYLVAVHIRGGDSSEVGYEFDGIPMNRAIDGYNSGSLSSLGQLELQVYTGRRRELGGQAWPAASTGDQKRTCRLRHGAVGSRIADFSTAIIEAGGSSPAALRTTSASVVQPRLPLHRPRATARARNSPARWHRSRPARIPSGQPRADRMLLILPCSVFQQDRRSRRHREPALRPTAQNDGGRAA